jgi:hypothetical protein
MINLNQSLIANTVPSKFKSFFSIFSAVVINFSGVFHSRRIIYVHIPIYTV